MPDNFDIWRFVDAVARQDAEEMRGHFEPGALIFWSATHEQFTVEEYIRVTREYPGKWSGKVERFDTIKGYEQRMSFVAKYWDTAGNAAYCVSFIDFGDTEDELIQMLDEYWCDISESPEWRQNLNIGTRMKESNEGQATP